MSSSPDDAALNSIHRQGASLLTVLAKLFSAMDREYQKVAEKSGFVCRGCEDNCCLTRFHHHTVIECLFLAQGLSELPPDEQETIFRRAEEVVQRYAALPPNADHIRMMCPLNVDGRCRLYRCRPMICRLHGIPHTFSRPDGAVIQGPGCSLYEQNAISLEKDTYLNRTPFYVQMAELEKKLRLRIDITGKIKLTVAEILIRWGRRPDQEDIL